MSFKWSFRLLHRYTLLKLSEPVLYHDETRRGRLVRTCALLNHEKSTAVWRDVVSAAEIDGRRCHVIPVKKFLGLAVYEAGRPPDFDTGQYTRLKTWLPNKKEFISATRPQGHDPASVGNRPAVAVHVRKRPNVNLITTRFVRLISQPATVRGQCRERLVEVRSHEWFDLTLLVQRQDHQIPSGLGEPLLEDNARAVR